MYVHPFYLTQMYSTEQNALFKRKVRAVPKKCVRTAAYNSGAQLAHGLCIGIVFGSFSLILYLHWIVAAARLHCIWVKPSHSLFNLNSYIMELTLTLDHFELDDKVSWNPANHLWSWFPFQQTLNIKFFFSNWFSNLPFRCRF